MLFSEQALYERGFENGKMFYLFSLVAKPCGFAFQCRCEKKSVP